MNTEYSSCDVFNFLVAKFNYTTHIGRNTQLADLTNKHSTILYSRRSCGCRKGQRIDENDVFCCYKVCFVSPRQFTRASQPPS